MKNWNFAERALVVVLVVVVAAACSAPAGPDVGSLRRLPALRYSVWMTGGAFVPVSPRGNDPEDSSLGPYPRTFGVDDGRTSAATAGFLEAIPIGDLAKVLDAAQVFVRLEVDDAGLKQRLDRAQAERGTLSDTVALEEPVMEAARGAGHDAVLVVRRIDDGPIEDQGINNRWPVTLLTWLGLGLGMVIPDRTYESRASLQIALLDVWSGNELYAEALGAGPVDLALVDRAGLLGIIQSIIVPPFWVGSTRTTVERRVRDDSARRFAVGLARRLKRVVTDEQIRSRRPIAIEVDAEDAGLAVRIRAREALSFIRVRRGSEPVTTASAASFEMAMLASQRPIEDRRSEAGFRCEARWQPEKPLKSGEVIQILAQSVAGRVGSTTFRLSDL